MPLIFRDIAANPGNNEFDLPVRVETDRLVVGPGEYVIWGKAYQFETEQVFELEPAAHPRLLNADLAEEISTGKGVILVDELVPGEEPFTPSGYQRLAPLFEGRVPDGATLPECYIAVYRYLLPKKED